MSNKQHPLAEQVVKFWQDAGPKLWFAKSPEFDERFRRTFAEPYQLAARGELDDWVESPDSALALILLLDQYPRNSFRGTPQMYFTDQLAVHHATRAIELGHDQRVDTALQVFFYLPFGHSESMADQRRGLELVEHFDEQQKRPAVEHANIVQRFGRFPHRNAIWGRPSSAAELDFLRNGGFAG